MNTRDDIASTFAEREHLAALVPCVARERRLTVILSADVQDYSRLMGVDAETTLRTLTAYRQLFFDVIVHHQGRMVDAIGDNILAEFASAVQAVQCALAIQHTLTEQNQALPVPRQMWFRIGLNLGDVIVEEERLYGDEVNIAARLASLADAGGVCLSGTVYDQVEGKLPAHYHFVGKQRLKNIARPVRVYQILAPPSPAGVRSQEAGGNRKEETRDVGLEASPLPSQVSHIVGRESALARLHEWLEKARSGQRQIVFISGEPGIGKTTLVDGFLAQVREQEHVRITSGQCVEQDGVSEAYFPLLDATTRLCRGPRGERRIEALKRYAPSWAIQLPGLVDPQELDLLQKRTQGVSRERMLREMAEAAELFASQRCLVLVLEDLHWSDTATLEWLTSPFKVSQSLLFAL